MSTFRQCLVLRLGLTDYPEGGRSSGRRSPLRRAPRTARLILLQHPPTYTLGVRGELEHLLASEAALARLGASVYRADRGGDVTFHRPGQIVGYLVFGLDAWGQGPLWYVRWLEAALIDTLATLGIADGRGAGPPRPGGARRAPSGSAAKIASIGVHVSRGVTSHGFALNVSPDLSYFAHIVPCGLTDAAVTSVERLLGRPVPLREVEDLVIDSLGRVFGLEMVEAKAKAVTAAGGLLRECDCP